MNSSLATKAAELIKTTDSLEQSLKTQIAQTSRQSNRLFESATKLAQCWSGSYFGYHSELYYGNFERPPLDRRFSPEWGGVHGIPPGWRSRGSDEVKAQIESEANAKLEDVELSSKAMTHAAQELQSEILVGLAPLQGLDGLASEKTLVSEIESFKWEIKAPAYTHEHLPNRFMSRDSSAVSEGAKIPAHLYFEAEAHESLSRCSFLPEFLRLAKRCLRQVEAQMLHQPTQATNVNTDAVALVGSLCTKFHFSARQLLNRRQKRTTLEVNDEYDVQDLLHSLLRAYFDDIRPEEWTPSYAGSASRMDFLLKSEQIVIEAKMTRPYRSNHEIADELIVDVTRYKSHPDCKTLVCLIYDPAGILKNPRGFEADFARHSDARLRVIAIVSP
jgi:REase_DpnII-MboI